jgi:aminopeptidase N
MRWAKILISWSLWASMAGGLWAQLVPHTYPAFTRADSLRGALRPERTSWDVNHYNLYLSLDIPKRSIRGENVIRFRVLAPMDRLQLDLFANLTIDRILWNSQSLSFEREHNAVWVQLPETLAEGSEHSLTVQYHGQPQAAAKPPWDGGFVWEEDPTGAPWVGVACEGDGASLWWPLKDHLGDKPDSIRITIEGPDTLMAVCNGDLVTARYPAPGRKSWTWATTYPINSYNVTFYLGQYTHFQDTYESGEYGPLQLDYYVLQGNEPQARKHFQQVHGMLDCFEQYLGPYPFRRDGFALVEAPYWGMEHQSAIAYGNEYENNRYGFDFIILHESGHEWFGNYISMADHGELWIHEAFTTYTEAIYLECTQGADVAQKYLLDQRRLIRNQEPILGPLDVNYTAWPDADMYYKGTWMLHTLRHIVQDDELWWASLRQMYDSLGGGTRTTHTAEVTGYWQQVLGSRLNELAAKMGINPRLGPFFDQFLRCSAPPRLEYALRPAGNQGWFVYYRWANVVPGFQYPLSFALNASPLRIYLPPLRVVPTDSWQRTFIPHSGPLAISPADELFYCIPQQVEVPD